MTHAVHNLFSKVFYQTYLEFNEEQLNVWVNHLEKEHTLGAYAHYTNNLNDDEKNFSESSLRKTILNDEIFKNLKKAIYENFNFFKNEYLRYVNNNFVITRSWVSKVQRGQSSFYHNHNNCMFSGIYYLKTDEGSGNINFENYENKRFSLKPDVYNLHNSNDFTFKTKNNLLIFFPSECFHRILKHNSDQTRYTIAFNFMPEGELGVDTNDSYCNLKII